MNAGTRLEPLSEPMHSWGGFEGVKIAGDSYGNVSGPTVVLLHGAGQTRHAWRLTGQRLGEAGYFVVAFDARGHGDSDWSVDGQYSQEAKIADLLAVLAALGRARPVLVGASMGGVTCLIAIGEGYVEASAVVLVDIVPRVEPTGAANIREFMNLKPDGFKSLEEVADAIASYQPHRERPRKLDGLAKNVRLGDDGKYHWHWDPRIRDNPVSPAERVARLEACVRRLGIPTVLIRGAMSDLVSDDGVQDFLRLCPQSEYVSVGGAAHMVAGDRNDNFANAIIEFLYRSVPIRVDIAQS